MAYVTGSKTGSITSVSTTHVMSLPSSVQNDTTFLHFQANGSASVSSIVGDNGGTWTLVDNTILGITNNFVYRCTQGATPDTSVTVTFAATERTSHGAINVRGADTTTPVDVSAVTSANTASPTWPSVTPTATNSLMLLFGSGGAYTLAPPTGVQLEYTEENVNFTNCMCGSTYQYAASATGSYTGYSRAVGTYNSVMLTVAVKDDTSAAIKPHHDLTTTAWTYLHLFGEGSGSLSDNTIYDPTDAANENISSLSNGSYTNSNAAKHFSATDRTNELELGITSKGFFTSSASYVDYILLSGYGITETYGSVDNYDLSNKLVAISFKCSAPTLHGSDDIGLCFGLSDKTNARFWQCNSLDTSPTAFSGLFPNLIDVSDATYEMDSVGTFNDASVGNIIVGYEPTTTYNYQAMSAAIVVETITIQGGTSSLPASFDSIYGLVKKGLINTVLAQGGLANNQFLVCHNTQCGGTETVYWDCSNQAVEWPAAYDSANKKINFKLGAGKLTHTIAPATGSTVIYDSTTLNFGNYHNFTLNSPNVAISSDGLNVLNADVTLTAHSGALSGVSFIGCKEITNSVDLSGGNTISNCVDTYAITVTSEAEFNKLQNCDFSGNNYSIRITGNHGGDTWSATGMTVAGGTGSYDIQYTGTGTLTIEVDTGSGWQQSRAEATVGTLTISAPTLTLTVNSNVAGSDLKIFTTNTQTIEASATGTTVNTTNTGTYDITVQKAGYLPQRQTGVALGSSSVTVNITLIEDPIYNASHGLTFTTDYSYNASTRVMTIVANQEGRDLYSALIDDFISETSLRNCPFPLVAVGPDRIDFKAVGYYNTATTVGATIDSGDIQYWKGAGMEWEHDTTGNPTKKFYSIKSANTLQAGTVVGYTQTNGGTPVETTLVSNKVNEVIQFFEDTDGNGTADYDYTGHLLFKGFLTGYYQARWDVINDSGITTLEPYEYTINLLQDAIAGTTGDQSITITTLTDHTGSPLSVGGKSFDYELVDPGTNTAEDLLAQHNYNVYNAVNTAIAGSLYTSYTAFDLPDLVVEAGSNYETERGYFEGDGLVTDRSGVYMSRSSADHPDISRFQSNDGTYYTPAVTANISVTGMPTAGGSIRLQIHNETAKTASAWAATTAYSLGDKVLRSTGVGTEQTAGLYMVCTTAGTTGGTEPTWDTTVGNTTADGSVTWTTYAILYYDDDPASSGYSDSYTDLEEFSSGDVYRIRFAELNGTTSFKTYETTGFTTSSGFTVAVDATADSVYAINAIDGSSTAVTNKFTADYTNDEIDLDTNTDFAVTEAFAYYCYELTTSQGMYEFWGGVTAIDAANYRNNTAVVSMYFDETAGFVKQTDSARWFRDDDARPAIDPTTGGNGIEINWRNPVYGYDAGGGGFTASDRATLNAAATQASVTALNDFDPVNDTVAHVTLCDTVTTNTDMRGTDGANTTAPDNASITAIKVKTDQLTFTKANELDSNIQSVNDVTVNGTGSEGDSWGP